MTKLNLTEFEKDRIEWKAQDKYDGSLPKIALNFTSTALATLAALSGLFYIAAKIDTMDKAEWKQSKQDAELLLSVAQKNVKEVPASELSTTHPALVNLQKKNNNLHALQPSYNDYTQPARTVGLIALCFLGAATLTYGSTFLVKAHHTRAARREVLNDRKQTYTR